MSTLSVFLPDCLLPPAQAGSLLADFSTLKMEAIHSSETSVHTRSTQPHIPEDGILQGILCLLSLLYIYFFFYFIQCLTVCGELL
jgi:hypothetical protein